MSRYWLHVADSDDIDLESGVISFKERWKDTLSKVKKGDQVITYLKKRSEFVGLGEVETKFGIMNNNKDKPYFLNLKPLNTKPIESKKLIPKLSFVTNKKKWYVHFNKSIYEIPEDDFNKISKVLKDNKKNNNSNEIDEKVKRLKKELTMRAPTGVEGLDYILEGGFPINSTILVTGGPGAGKTILSLQYLLQGIKQGDPGIFISLDERPDDLRKEALKFGWDLTKYEREGKLVIVDVSYPRSGLPSKEKYQIDMPFTLDNIVRTVYEIISDINGKRVVLDSLPAFGLHFEDEAEVRIAIHRLNNLLLSSGCTSIITSETIPGKEGISRFGVEEFIVRGIVHMGIYVQGQEYKRAMSVFKMRETAYEMKRFSFVIGRKGIEVRPKEVLYIDETSRVI